jgi:hypothetical protein
LAPLKAQKLDPRKKVKQVGPEADCIGVSFDFISSGRKNWKIEKTEESGTKHVN